jgi:hypothetical protein
MTIKSTSQYLESHLREYLTDEFAYASYNTPNTTYRVSNDLDGLLLECSNTSIRLWHMVMMRVKRNTDPVIAVTVRLHPQDFSGGISRNAYYKSMNELTSKRLLLATHVKGEYIVNIQYANKLYNPKLEF